MGEIRVFHIASYSADRPNGIKSVLEQIIPIQKKQMDVELLNLKEEKIKKIENKDLVIFHGVYNLKYIFLCKELIKNKIPYIIVPHCSLTKISLNQSRLKKKIFNFFAKKFYKNAVAIGFLNEEERKSSIEINKNYIYLPNGVNLFNKIEKQAKNNSEISIMYLSRIDVYHKGIDLFLEALGLIKNELLNRKVKINIYGDGNDKSMSFFYDKIKELKIENIINYNGRVEGAQKEKAFLENQIFILTSRFEGFPMAVLEALSYGLPCILTEGTNMKSMIEKYDSGWICKAEVEDISKMILNSVQEYKAKKIKYKENALKNATDYQWENIIEKHLKIYKKIIRQDKNDII